MRLIDANKLVQAIVEERNKIPLRVPCAPYELLDDRPHAAGQNQRGGIRKALRCVANAPTIDAVPVVRCRNCRHKDRMSYDDVVLCTRRGKLIRMTANDFCSYGERKDGDG